MNGQNERSKWTVKMDGQNEMNRERIRAAILDGGSRVRGFAGENLMVNIKLSKRSKS